MRLQHPSHLYLVRHAETEWTKTRRHTGRSDPGLTEKGVQDAKALKTLLSAHSFEAAFTSPSKRATTTSVLAGFSALSNPDLAEWDYGDYEGLTTQEILEKNPEWNLFQDGAPGGEGAMDVGLRADRFLQSLAPFKKNVLIFSSAHFLRVLAARFLGLAPEKGNLWTLSPASLSILGWEHGNPVINVWNDILN